MIVKSLRSEFLSVCSIYLSYRWFKHKKGSSFGRTAKCVEWDRYDISQGYIHDARTASEYPRNVRDATESFIFLYFDDETGDRRSLCRKYLDVDKQVKLRHLQTSNGGGAYNGESVIGVNAPDAEAYDVFRDLFDPIIAEIHGRNPSDKQPDVDYGEDKYDTLPPLDPDGQYIVSTRIRYARNIKGKVMFPLFDGDMYRAMEKKMFGIFVQLSKGKDSPAAIKNGKYIQYGSLSKEEEEELTSRGLLFRSNDKHHRKVGVYRKWPAGRGVYLSEDEKFHVWVAEEDHLRIIALEKGSDFGSVLRRLNEGYREIEKKLEFERHDRLGWITSCPTNLGCATRASVFIRLPRLSQRKDFKRICKQLKLQVRGTNGERSRSTDGIVDIANARRFGITEYGAVKELYDGVKKLIEMEKREPPPKYRPLKKPTQKLLTSKKVIKTVPVSSS